MNVLTLDLTKREGIEKLIEQHIAQGRWKVGQRLPSRRVLAAKQNISQAPVRQALRELTQKGIIRSQPGRRGLFVAPAPSPLPSQKLSSIAVAYETISDMPQLDHAPLMSQLELAAMGEEAVRRDKVLRQMPYPSPSVDRDDLTFRDMISKHQVVIFSGIDYLHWFEYLRSVGTHALYITSHYTPERVNVIRYDVGLFQRTAVEHLIAFGHRRIAFLGDVSTNNNEGVKLLNYVKCLVNTGLEIGSELIVAAPGFQLDGYTAMGRLLKRLPRDRWPTAVATDTDYKAMGVIAAARDLGLKVPRDLSVVGQDNRPVAKTVVPSLTTVGPDWPQLGKIMLDAIDRLSNESYDQPIKLQVPMEVAIRNSTAPLTAVPPREE